MPGGVRPVSPQEAYACHEAAGGSEDFRGMPVHLDLAPLLAKDALGIDQLALTALDVGQVLARAKAGTVVVVVVEDRLHARLELLVVGHLHHDVVVHAGLRVEMPQDDRIE